MKRKESPEPEGGLTHVEGTGEASRARMVDVSAKAESVRTAVARAAVRFPPGLLGPVLEGGGPKGPIEEVARTAGILAAKRTAELIPLCHPLGLDHVDVVFERGGEDVLLVRCSARCTGRTGVEMEAMTGAAVAALTVYDMVKAVERGVTIAKVQIVEKLGGKSGHWRR